MAGLYIHIPFCKQRCHYCDFYFVTNTKLESEFVAALKKEISARKNETAQVETIYFGGGTPSIINPKHIQDILTLIYTEYTVVDDAEITLEANPDDLTTEHLQAFYDAGINRLSIGIQSFDDEYLKWMNRSHTAEEALTVIDRATQIGFKDFSIDLIYGIPGMDEKQWQQQLKTAASLQVNHLSCYCLTVEPKTPLDKFIKKKIYTNTDDDMQSKHFKILMEMAPTLGFEQYEISNFARNQHYSKHNTAYWEYKPYIGFGPSAHSFDGITRRHHASSLSAYIQDPIALIEEALTEEERFNEYILIGLRTSKGVNIEAMKNKFSETIYTHFEKELSEHENKEHIYIQDGFLRLSDGGKIYADSVASAFFLV